MKNFKIWCLLLILIFVAACGKTNNENLSGAIAQIKQADNPSGASFAKKAFIVHQDKVNFNFLPTSTTNQVIVHDHYTLSYNEQYEQAEWVAYALKKGGKDNSYKRPFFIEDPKVKTHSADWKNYKNSGFDKGHLCPAGDMKFSKKAFEDTFYTSNISPQRHEFNEGVWNRLEQKIRYWSDKYGTVYVVTGAVLTANLKTIGTEKVAVPEFFYKVLLTKSNGSYRMIAFIVPNQKSDRPLYEFVVSTNDVEKRTGIDFFPQLDDKLENALEKNSDYKGWSF